jgi:tRNA pseudouridine55 synthase
VGLLFSTLCVDFRHPHLLIALHGFLNLNKPRGVTSRDVVNAVARPLKKLKLKVGHAGTLDPLATGVLVVAIGSATRLIENVQQLAKRYRTVARLGATSDTLDADGTIVETPAPRIPSESEIRQALATQVGTVLQTPPQFSALRVHGQRSYDLARAGRTVELVPRPVRIDRIELLRFAWPALELLIDCGSGTYVRSIIRDLGETMRCGALIDVLERTRIGPFTLADAIAPEGFTLDSITEALRPETDAVPELPKITASPADAAAITHGRAIPAPEGLTAGAVAILNAEGDLLALANVVGGQLQPAKVLGQRAT